MKNIRGVSNKNRMKRIDVDGDQKRNTRRKVHSFVVADTPDEFLREIEALAGKGAVNTQIAD